MRLIQALLAVCLIGDGIALALEVERMRRPTCGHVAFMTVAD